MLPPLRRKYVELVRSLGVPVGGEHNRLAIRREFRKGREAAEVGHLFQARAVDINQVQLEFPCVASLLVRREQNPLAIRRESGGETRAAEIA